MLQKMERMLISEIYQEIMIGFIVDEADMLQKMERVLISDRIYHSEEWYVHINHYLLISMH